MSTLVPKHITDRNGVNTIRHVRADLGGGSKSSGIPAPALTRPASDPVESEKYKSMAIVEAIARELAPAVDPDPQSSYSRVSGALRGIDSALLEPVLRLITASDELSSSFKSRTLADLRENIVFYAILEGQTGELVQALKPYNHHMRKVRNVAEKVFGTSKIYVPSAENIRDFQLAYLAESMDYSASSHKDGLAAYYREMGEVSRNYEDVMKALPVIMTINNGENYHLLSDNWLDVLKISRHTAQYSPDQILRIAEIINDRGADMDYYDEELIDNILDSPSAALSEGVI